MSDSAFDSISVVVLAAGNSTRMGVAKQLLDFRGQPLLRHAVQTALATGCGHVVAVLGAGWQHLLPVLRGLDVEVVLNDRWAQGMGTSIQAGLNGARARDAKGVILSLADQPFVTSESLAALVNAHHATTKAIVASRYSETVGVPVFFAREAFPSLLALGPDQGCKGAVLTAAAADRAYLLDCPEAAIDLDTPEDYRRAVTGDYVTKL
jgi:molybdenum cofactor cytidylyltransferase